MTAPPTLHLGIGEMIVRQEPARISTLLGSCVSVSLYSAEARAGGLIHYALPDPSYGTGTSRGALHFGTEAIAALVTKMSQLAHCSPVGLEAKIVGGAAVLSGLSAGTEIGAQNILTARRELERLNVKVTGEKTGGHLGYRLFFRTDTGQLLAAQLRAPEE